MAHDFAVDRLVIDSRVPAGELHFRDKDGRTVGKIVGVSTAAMPHPIPPPTPPPASQADLADLALAIDRSLPDPRLMMLGMEHVRSPLEQFAANFRLRTP